MKSAKKWLDYHNPYIGKRRKRNTIQVRELWNVFKIKMHSFSSTKTSDIQLNVSELLSSNNNVSALVDFKKIIRSQADGFACTNSRYE